MWFVIFTHALDGSRYENSVLKYGSTAKTSSQY